MLHRKVYRARDEAHGVGPGVEVVRRLGVAPGRDRDAGV